MKFVAVRNPCDIAQMATIKDLSLADVMNRVNSLQTNIGYQHFHNRMVARLIKYSVPSHIY